MHAPIRLGPWPAALAALVAAAVLIVAPSPHDPAPTRSPAPPASPPGAESLLLPLVFEGPSDPADPLSPYRARRPGYLLELAPTVATFHLAPHPHAAPRPPAVVRARLIDADPAAPAEGLAPLRGRVNYLIGDDPTRWRLGVPLFRGAAFRGVYPGVDVVYRDDGHGQTEYDFVLAPGADPSRIAIAIDGETRRPEIDAAGNLHLHTDNGVLTHRRPIAWQEERDGERRVLPSRFVLADEGHVGFEVDGWDGRTPLVIDPVLVYSTYIGGDGADRVNAVALGPDGHVFITGETNSLAGTITDGDGNPLDFPTRDPLPGHEQLAGVAYPPPDPRPHPLVRKYDAFIGRLDTTQSGADSLVYMTFFGGAAGDDRAFALAVDQLGRAHVGGLTSSNDLPLANPLQTCRNSVNSFVCDLNISFVARLSANGQALEYASYLNGNDSDVVTSLAVGPSGHLHVGGRTHSNVGTSLPVAPSNPSYNSLFPITPDGFQTVRTSSQTEGFLLVLDLDLPQAAQLAYGTLFGGCGADDVRTIAVDWDGAVVMAGATQPCPDATKAFPLLNAFQSTYQGGLTDGWVARLDPWIAGPAGLEFSTLLGGTYDENDLRKPALALDAQGNIHLGGTTSSHDFPTTPGAAQRCPGMHPNNALLYPCDPVTGQVSGSPPNGTVVEGYVSTFSPAGQLLHSTYLGGTAVDQLHALGVRADGHFVYVAGQTASSGLAVSCAPQTTLKGSRDVYQATLRLIPDDANGFASQRVFYTYLGGGTDEQAEGLTYDPYSDSVFVVGYVPYNTTSNASFKFPTTPDALQPAQPGNGTYDNGFLAEISQPYACAPDLFLRKGAHPEQVEPGCALTYTIHVSNTGVLPASNVVMSDPLPAALSLLAVTSTHGTCDGSTTVSCALGTLAPGESAVITIETTLSASYSPTQPPIVNTASVTSSEADANPADNSASITSHVKPTSVCGCYQPTPDADADGIADCVDGCPDDPAKSDPGACACGVPDADVDLDGVIDCLEPPNDPPVVDLSGPSSVASDATASFTFSVSDTPGDVFSLALGSPSCGTAGELIAASLTVVGNEGNFQCKFAAGPASSTVSVQVVDGAGEASDVATLAVSVAAPVAPSSWVMLGNGKLGSVHHQFKLSCDPWAPDQGLKVKWGANTFALTSIDDASCDDDPGIAPGMPPAPFDTHAGSGVGTLNGAPGATIIWTFSDAGEPGFSDQAAMLITDAQGVVVLQLGGAISPGNHQAQVQ